MKNKNFVALFRWVAVAEGISYLMLFAVSMPLKYIWGIGQPNKVIGIAHGLLFVVYLMMLPELRNALRLNGKAMFWLIIASFLPFGTFVGNKRVIEPAEQRIN